MLYCFLKYLRECQFFREIVIFQKSDPFFVLFQTAITLLILTLNWTAMLFWKCLYPYFNFKWLFDVATEFKILLWHTYHLALRNPVPCAGISRPRALPPLDTPALGPLPAPGSLGVVPSGNAVARGVPQQNVQSMAMSLTNRTQGMFSGAVFHGQVNITINNK